MPRSRLIRPEFWSDEKLASVSRESRLTYAGLWGTSDDYGVTKGNAAWLKSQIFPYDEDLKITKFTEWLSELEGLRRIIPFTKDGEKYYYIPKFIEHQKVDKPSKNRNPLPPEDIESRVSRETVASDSRESSDETETETHTLLEWVRGFLASIPEEDWKSQGRAGMENQERIAATHRENNREARRIEKVRTMDEGLRPIHPTSDNLDKSWRMGR